MNMDVLITHKMTMCTPVSTEDHILVPSANDAALGGVIEKNERR